MDINRIRVDQKAWEFLFVTEISMAFVCGSATHGVTLITMHALLLRIFLFTFYLFYFTHTTHSLSYLLLFLNNNFTPTWTLI